jgi:hypothetical protein
VLDQSLSVIVIAYIEYFEYKIAGATGFADPRHENQKEENEMTASSLEKVRQSLATKTSIDLTQAMVKILRIG